MHEHMFKFIHAKVRAGVLPTAFAVILAPVALQILLKVEFNFEVIIYITIFVCHIRKAALNMWSVLKTYLKVLRSSCCHGDCRKKNVFTRNVWGLCTPWFSVLRPPKDWFVIFLSILKPKAVISPWIGILKEKNVFQHASSEVLTVVLWESRVWKLCTCQLFIQSILPATQASIYLTWCDDGY